MAILMAGAPCSAYFARRAGSGEGGIHQTVVSVAVDADVLAQERGSPGLSRDDAVLAVGA
jgi:hypothetical protein